MSDSFTWEPKRVFMPIDFGDDTSRWAVILPNDPKCEDTVCAWYVIDETGPLPIVFASGSDPTMEEAINNAETAFKEGRCPECGSDEVFYENPHTGSGCFSCQDCLCPLTNEEALKLKEGRDRLKEMQSY